MAHQLMVEALRQGIGRYCESTCCAGESILNYGDHIIKAPDAIWISGENQDAVGEISWAHETITQVEQQLFISSAAGYNALAVKGWFGGRDGNAACQSITLDLPYQNLSQMSSVLFMSKAAGSPSIPQVWRLGEKARAVRLSLPHTEERGETAWLSASWFSTGTHRFPLPLSSIGDAIAVALQYDRGLPRGVRNAVRAESNEASLAVATSEINANPSLDEEARAWLLARTA